MCELVERSFDLIGLGKSRLNAVVSHRAEEALVEAAEQDHRLAAGEVLGPLGGVPLLVRNLEGAAAGMVTTQGSLVWDDTAPAARDAINPDRLRLRAGLGMGGQLRSTAGRGCCRRHDSGPVHRAAERDPQRRRVPGDRNSPTTFVTHRLLPCDTLEFEIGMWSR